MTGHGFRFSFETGLLRGRIPLVERARPSLLAVDGASRSLNTNMPFSIDYMT